MNRIDGNMVLSLMSHISHITLSRYAVGEHVIDAQNDDEGESIYCHTSFFEYCLSPNQ